MMRRSRIKPVANLSTSRRGVNKPTADVQNASKEKEIESQEIAIDLPQKQETSEVSGSSPTPDVKPSSEVINFTENPKSSEIVEKLNEKSHERDSAEPENKDGKMRFYFMPQCSCPDESGTFKTPLQMPRTETESSGSSSPGNKFRRFKVAPRLVVKRVSIAITGNSNYFFNCSRFRSLMTQLKNLTKFLPT